MDPQNKNNPVISSAKDLQNDVEKQLADSQAKIAGIPQQSPFPHEEKSQYTPNPALKTLRTYQGDVEEAMDKKKTSIISIAVAEQETAPKKNLANVATPREQRNIDRGESLISKLFSLSVLPLVGLISVVVGALALTGAYYFVHYRAEPVAVSVPQTLIPQNNLDTMTLDPSNGLQSQIINRIIADVKKFNGQAGTILAIQFVDGTTHADLSENTFFQTIALGAPDTLTRSMTGNYATGVYSGSTNEPFLLLSTESYGQGYAGMLSWEPVMATDFSAVFPSQQQANASSSVPTWTDDTFANQDVRVLRAANGSISLVYGFLDNNTILITGNETAFQALANKYLDAKLVH